MEEEILHDTADGVQQGHDFAGFCWLRNASGFQDLVIAGKESFIDESLLDATEIYLAYRRIVSHQPILSSMATLLFTTY